MNTVDYIAEQKIRSYDVAWDQAPQLGKKAKKKKNGLVKHASYLELLYLLQKKAIRTITFSPRRTRSKPLFSKLTILSLHSLHKFHVSCFVFSHFNRLLPASLSSLLHFNRDFHDYLTRSRFNLHKMSLRYQFAISSQAPTIWNDIPLTVRDSLTTTNFKKKLKLHFLSLN